MSNTEMFSTGRGPGGARPDIRFRIRAGLNWWQAIAGGAATAALCNLAILFIGRATGASFAYLDRGTLHAITAWGVIVTTVLPLVVGIGLAALLARWWFWVIRLAQVIGGGLALLSVAGPVIADTDGATRLALVLMHVVVAVAVVVTLEAIRRHAKASHQA
ncbi:MAG: DUF6069 family protein [Pseudonocardiaceae bacterium]